MARVYLTRDSDTDGKVSDQVDVWTVKPTWFETTPHGKGTVWIDTSADLRQTFTPMHVAAAEKRYGSVPTTDAVCLSVEVDE
jgi:hypothetical protein